MTYFQAPPITVSLPRSPSPLFVLRGPLTQEGNLDSDRLARDIGSEVGLHGKVALEWLSDSVGILSHEGIPKLTVRVQ